MRLTLALPFALTVVAGLAAAVLIYFLVLLVRNEAVYVPLPQETIDSMLKMAEIGPDDVLFDLGSGDGRVVIAAARRYGIRAVGIEKSGMLAWLSKRAVRKNMLEDRVHIVNGDFFEQDLSEATVVTVYLSQKMNDRLEPKLRKELKQGTRILSADHTFNFEERTKTKTGHFWTHLYMS
jgi:precorrin-6B methylase 2